jgi:cell division protein FtsI (penicillin-binding protein 3)
MNHPPPRRPNTRPNTRSGTRPRQTARSVRKPAARPPVRRIRLAKGERRLRVAMTVLTVVLSLFAGRLLQLQGVDAAAYAVDGTRERLRTVTVEALRGSILDAHGRPLATTIDVYNITADQQLTSSATQKPVGIAARLAPVLGMNTATLATRLTGNRRFIYVATNVSPATRDAVRHLRLPGVFSERASKRSYPAGSLAANVVGFVNGESVGAGGVEYAYQDVLAGRNGRETFEVNRRGDAQIPMGTFAASPVREGQSVQLTIDSDIQWAAQQAIADQVARTGSESGTVIVQDVRNGQILALATAPSFDPGKLANADASALGNRALSEIYEPGSTSKVMTAAAAIEEGVVTESTPVTIPPTLRRAGRTFHDHDPHGTEQLTFAGVLAKSSNIGTIMVAERMSTDTLYRYLTKFGIGSPTGLDWPGESRGILAPPDQWSSSTRYTIPFGQGLSVNSVQATSVFATIANNGLRVAPSLVKAIVDADGTVHPTPAPRTDQVISPHTATIVRDMMESVVSDDGTAPSAQIPGYRVAGKTGTANRSVNGRYSGYTASFIGVAPADKPRLAVSVVLQAPKRGHFGGLLGGPVFKKVMSFALQALRIPPTGVERPRLRLRLD